MGNATKGTGVVLFALVKWLLWRILGVLDVILTLAGISPRKKLRVQAVILRDEAGQPLATESQVAECMELAKDVFAEELNVDLIPPKGSPLVMTLEENAPPECLEIGCGTSIIKCIFSDAGAWYRKHHASTKAGTTIGYGAPITVFVIRDVKGKSGCSAGVLSDYTVVDRGAINGHEGSLLTIAHEIGHACDLTHFWSGTTVMRASPNGRTRQLLRRQAALVRSNPHVTYL